MKDQCDWPKCYSGGEVVYRSGGKSVFLCDTHWAAVVSDNLSIASRARRMLRLPHPRTVPIVQPPVVEVSPPHGEDEQDTRADFSGVVDEEVGGSKGTGVGTGTGTGTGIETRTGVHKSRRKKESLDFAELERRLLAGRYD